MERCGNDAHGLASLQILRNADVVDKEGIVVVAIERERLLLGAARKRDRLLDKSTGGEADAGIASRTGTLDDEPVVLRTPCTHGDVTLSVVVAQVDDGRTDGTRYLAFLARGGHSAEPALYPLQARSLPAGDVREVVDGTIATRVFAMLDETIGNVALLELRLHEREVLIEHLEAQRVLGEGVLLHLLHTVHIHLLMARPAGRVARIGHIGSLEHGGLADGIDLHLGRSR